jgi:hypothetical protein
MQYDIQVEQTTRASVPNTPGLKVKLVVDTASRFPCHGNVSLDNAQDYSDY